uniref:Uncharacterized protein n=1 Tax=Acrobeloides nanus TaxID=290746 RepID=A0A914CQF1_9BILA
MDNLVVGACTDKSLICFSPVTTLFKVKNFFADSRELIKQSLQGLNKVHEFQDKNLLRMNTNREACSRKNWLLNYV